MLAGQVPGNWFGHLYQVRRPVVVMATYAAERRDEALALYVAYGTSEASRRTSNPRQRAHEVLDGLAARRQRPSAEPR